MVSAEPKILPICGRPWQAYSTLVGGALFYLYSGSFYCVSEITPYLTSYYGLPVEKAQYVFAIQCVVNSCCMFYSGFLARNFNPRLILATAGILGPVAFWLSSFMPSFILWVVMFNVTYSVTNAATYMVPVHHAWLWFPDRPGFASGVIMGFYGVSGLIWNNVALALVNPEHIDAVDGFYPDKVNKRVPYMLQTLAYFYVGLVTLSIIFLFPGPIPSQDDTDKEVTEELLKTNEIPVEYKESEESTIKAEINKSTVQGHMTSEVQIQDQEDEITFMDCFKDRMAWIIWVMSIFSVMVGLITVDCMKTFALSRDNLNHEEYITQVVSLSCIFNAGRALWAVFLDYFSYKQVYGGMLILQTILGFTYYFSSKSMVTYAIWVWLGQWCEGGHFTIIPNILKIIYGKHATQLYGFVFCYIGVSSSIMIGLLRSPLGTEYFLFWGVGSCMSIVSMVILFTKFDQTKFADRFKKEEAFRKQSVLEERQSI